MTRHKKLKISDNLRMMYAPSDIKVTMRK